MEDSKTPPSIPYNFPIYVLTSVFLLRVLVSLHRNNHSSMFYRITVQRKFTGQHLRWRPLFIKLKLVALQLCDIRVPSKHFPMKFVKIFRTVFYLALPGYCSCTIVLYFGKNFYLHSKIYYQIKSLKGFQDCFQILNSLSPL